MKKTLLALLLTLLASITANSADNTERESCRGESRCESSGHCLKDSPYRYLFIVQRNGLVKNIAALDNVFLCSSESAISYALMNELYISQNGFVTTVNVIPLGNDYKANPNFH